MRMKVLRWRSPISRYTKDSPTSLKLILFLIILPFMLITTILLLASALNPDGLIIHLFFYRVRSSAFYIWCEFLLIPQGPFSLFTFTVWWKERRGANSESRYILWNALVWSWALQTRRCGWDTRKILQRSPRFQSRWYPLWKRRILGISLPKRKYDYSPRIDEELFEIQWRVWSNNVARTWIAHWVLLGKETATMG